MNIKKIVIFINLFFIFLIAPLLGIGLAFFETQPVDSFIDKSNALTISSTDLTGQIDQINYELDETRTLASITGLEIEKMATTANQEYLEYQEQKNNIEKLTNESKKQTDKSDVALEQVLSSLLGDPISVHKGKNSDIKVYTLNEAGYRGYMAKVNVKTSDGLKLVLADDSVMSNGETTSQAAKRTGAKLAVNAGGYWKTKDGKLAPLGITVVDGEIKTFYYNPKLSFVGFNTSGHLVGGKYSTEEEIKNNKILQGSSFVPTLLEDGKKVDIPSDWANQRHPRTIVGNFSNGELLFIVIDGRRDGWSNGVTLEEVQDKLLSFKVKDAFNLDGGGSSTFYYDGKVLNKPSDGRERPVTSNIVILP